MVKLFQLEETYDKDDLEILNIDGQDIYVPKLLIQLIQTVIKE